MSLRARWMKLKDLRWLRARVVRPDRAVMRAALAGGLAALAVVLLNHGISAWLIGQPPVTTQAQINAAVEHSLQEITLPSPAAKAYETILPSVVRVDGYVIDPKTKEAVPYGVGTGVVIVDNGTILTNLHVVSGADKIKVTFMDGSESVAHIEGMRPEHDLAVIRAHTIPDDMMAATMASTEHLAPGDHVFAVGFPFGIGPSISAGVVSGLKRDFMSPQGKRLLTNLIQFDAAANPGNSGGPLVTAEGEVVGIVTAIFNPNEQRTFIGIGFAVPIENAAGAVGMPPF